MTPNGSLYTRKKQGFLPALMEKMYTDRVKYKDLMIKEQKKGKAADTNKLAQYHNMQINLKIALNSAYGALGNQWFRFYDVRNAEAVSVAGQLSIRWAERAVNKYLNKVLETDGRDYVIASDTDSLYVTLDSLVQKVGLEDKDKIIKVSYLCYMQEWRLTLIVCGGGQICPRFFIINNKSTFDRRYHSLTPF